MRVPGQNVHDFSISGGNSTTVPLEILNNHLYLTGVMVDGHDLRSCMVAAAIIS